MVSYLNAGSSTAAAMFFVALGFLQQPTFLPSGCRIRSQSTQVSRLPRVVIGDIPGKCPK
jgi:hypothetical protein